MSEKVGRNDPCLCGSGKKFKKCCGADTEIHITLSPTELVLARVEAFRSGDFGFIFDTYHKESYFRQQFTNRGYYIQTGKTSLSTDYRIDNVAILKEQKGESVDGNDDEEWQVIFLLDTFNGSKIERTYELSRFLLTDKGWRYHSSQKLSAADLTVSENEVDFCLFGAATDKVWF